MSFILTSYYLPVHARSNQNSNTRRSQRLGQSRARHPKDAMPGNLHQRQWMKPRNNRKTPQRLTQLAARNARADSQIRCSAIFSENSRQTALLIFRRADSARQIHPAMAELLHAHRDQTGGIRRSLSRNRCRSSPDDHGCFRAQDRIESRQCAPTNPNHQVPECGHRADRPEPDTNGERRRCRRE